MKLARPGTIKGKCNINALITLKEYLDDFASGVVKDIGYKMIDHYFKQLNPSEKDKLTALFSHVSEGIRDEFI